MPMLKFAPPGSEKRLSLAIASALLLAAVCPRSLPAHELTSEVEALFELGEKNTPPAVAAAKERYERLKRGFPRERRIDYAYGVVLLNQHKYPEALEVLTTFREGGARDVALSQTTVWALVQDRKVIEALQEMVALSQSLNDAGDRDHKNESNDQTARFIGGMFGYLELVRPGGVEHELRSKYRNMVLKNLGDRYTPMFDAGRAAVAERLANLKADRKAAQERKTASYTARLERDKAALDDDRGEIADNKEAMQWHLDSMRDAQRELSVLGTQMSSLQADRTRLAAQMVIVQARITELTRAKTNVLPTNVIDNRQPGPGNVDFRTTTTTVTNSVYGPTTAEFAQVSALAMSLGRLNKQAFDMDRRLLSLQQRAAELSDQSWRDADSLYQHDAAMQRTASAPRP